MKTKLLTLCLVFAMPLGLLATDIIHLNNGLIKAGRIVEYTETHLIFENPETGIQEVISKDMIARVELEDKTLPALIKRDDFLFPEEETEEKEYNKKNVISLNYLEFGVLLNLHLTYERILSKGYLGLAVNYAMSMEPIKNKGSYQSNLNYQYINRYSFDINLYPTGQHRVSYFIGPSLIYGTFKYDDEDPTTPIEDRAFTSFLINNGVVFQVIPNFSMGIKAGLGMVREIDDSGEYQGIDVSTPLVGFNVSLRL